MATQPALRTGMRVRCDDVVHLYRTFAGHDVRALQGVDLTIEPGERVALLGPSGSGKSTLLSLLGGVQRPSAGNILLDDMDISRLDESRLSRIRARDVSTMLQGAARNLLPYATVRQNLQFSRLALTSGDDGGISDDELVDRIALSAQLDQRVSTLSGGQQQRLALACALVSGPRLLLADEPTSRLNHEDRDRVLELIHDLAAEYGTTVAVVTHQPEVAVTFPRSVWMLGGRVGSEGHEGHEYVVVGKEGVLHLPPAVARHWSAGTLVRVDHDEADPDTVSLTRAREDR